MIPVVAKAYEIAHAEVGTREIGAPNCGTRVEEYQASVGLPKKSGASWCAAGIYFCFMRASMTLGLPNPCPRTGGALKMMRQSQIGYHCEPGEATQGSLIFEAHGTQGLGHVSMLLETHPDEFIVLAFNSNTDGSRNGNQCCIHPLRRDDPRIVGAVDFSRPLLPVSGDVA